MREKLDVANFRTIADYISAKPLAVQEQMQNMYAILKAALPQAEERFSYQMPSFWQGQTVVYFDAGSDFIGFYPTAEPIAHFATELAPYKSTKGAVRFPLADKLPADLITAMVHWRLGQIKAGVARPTRTKRAQNSMPDFVEAALSNHGLMQQYKARPPYQRNDYLGWIAGAKRPATQQKRLQQMLSELAAGDVYMKMAWHHSQNSQQ
ncbi:YdeI/OmpD-associated family protein [Lacticaseibacillus zhaodongensis]|uniref:YdeI/OmpD-associated family protein n=1 Tax=Lacticaseibacillus zhaodongensis TaxID=2668065 RepID=UPI0018AFDCF8|nr:DUF1801 domain-containing protein [Lacticaseibacillus zhaodongensis]